MYIVFLLLIWSSIIGYCLLLKDKFKIKVEFTIPIIFSTLSVVMFVGGILNMLPIFNYILVVIGIIFLIKHLVKHKCTLIESLKHPNINVIIIFILFLYVTIIFSNGFLSHYDNFSHWGTIVKDMLLDNSYPSFLDTAIEFKAYQPGTATFIYYFCNLTKSSESMMIIAQNYLIVGFLVPLLALTNNKKHKIISILLVLTTMFFVSTTNIFPYELLVDTVLSAVLISCFAFAFTYKNDTKKLFYCLLIISLFLTLIKNVGIVLVLINCLIILFIEYKNKNLKKGLFYSLIITLSCLLLLLIWNRHVVLVFGRDALRNRHALSARNIIPHLYHLGINGIIGFIQFYLKHFFDYKNNIAFVIIAVINLLMILMMIFYKKKKLKILKYIVMVDLIYIYYYLALGLMLLCSMDNIYSLPGFNRYIFTIVAAIVGLLTIIVLNEINGFSKKYITYILMFIIIVLEISYVCFYDNKDFVMHEDYKIFIGQNDYKDSKIYLVDKAIGDKYSNENNSYQYYIYAPNLYDTSGYLFFMFRYKLNHGKINIIENLDSLNEIDENTLIVALEIDDSFNKFKKKNNLCKQYKRVYKLCD